jgi:hypothetical protein
MLMAVMMQPREKWTDERLDDLQGEMRAGFARVDAELRALRRDMLAGFVVIVAAIIGSNAALIASNAF